MSEESYTTILEKKLEDILVRIVVGPEEEIVDAYWRLDNTCGEISIQQKIKRALEQIESRFGLPCKNLVDTGINNDYQRVLLSLVCNHNKWMGATDVSNDWGAINTGNVSRVFTGSRPSTAIYKGHFEKCDETGKYRFTRRGLEYALERGIGEILESLQSQQDPDSRGGDDE